ncbi:MAG: cysteine desulfurase family protein [Ruminococcus sp.]|nr:cysteine desulfurase family protein [Ruminococcus sp.]
MDFHYLDNSATTKVSEGAANKAIELMRHNFGNPSSLHSFGFEAEKELNAARQAVAEAIGAKESEIYFTSGGTEANNLALMGVAEAKKRAGKKIVTTAIEHSSIIDTAKHLESSGFEVEFVYPKDKNGFDVKDFENAIDENTILVSVMMTNNETGLMPPVSKIPAIIKRKNSPALFHIDAVQGLGKENINVTSLKCDLMSISAHKIHGAKGVGALYVKKGVRILPRTFGGKQENSLRPGTEALPLIGAFGVAAKEINIFENREKITELNLYLRQQLASFDDIIINSPEDASPYILNFSARGIRSETMLHHLSSYGVYISSGSACSKGGKSHVLSALKLNDDLADSAVRVSFSKESTIKDVDALLEALEIGLNTLQRKKK